MKRGALFSSCRTFRYRLWRAWDSGPRCLFVMLNPSTADEVANDPTVERCERRAREWGYPGVEVCNIFALRSTDPRALYSAADPFGPLNDIAIRDAAREAGLIVCAWGAHGKLHDRGDRVRIILSDYRLHALRINKDGTPAHPLYLPYSLEPIPLNYGTTPRQE